MPPPPSSAPAANTGSNCLSRKCPGSANVCSHAYALLSDGWLDGHLIECPLHNGQFDVRTGQGQGAPITTDIRAYKTRVDGKDVLIALP